MWIGVPGVTGKPAGTGRISITPARMRLRCSSASAATGVLAPVSRSGWLAVTVT